MALPGGLLVRLRALCSRSLQTGVGGSFRRAADMRCYRTKARSLAAEPGGPQPPAAAGRSPLEDPKCLLNNTISRSLGVSDLSQFIQYSCTDNPGVKRATVTVLWPCRIVEEGLASKKINAERLAAAAACQRLKEMGVIGPNNQLPQRGSGRERGGLQSPPLPLEPNPWMEDDSRARVAENQSPSPAGHDEASEALLMFPQPKCLLSRVLQLASSSNRVSGLMEYKTRGQKLKKCQLSLRWPEQMSFTATANTKALAERRAAALACSKLKDLELLDENNNPLTHASYCREQVKEAGERSRRPLQLELPHYLHQLIREHLQQHPVDAEIQKLAEADEESEQRILAEEEEEEEECVLDAVTGRPYRPPSERQAGQLSLQLQELWRRWEAEGGPRGAALPVDGHRQRLLAAVRESRVVVIAGETGCGKTTRIPRFLLEEGVSGGEGARCNVLVTQPRRISAVSVAHRVAQEMGPTLRHCVGHQVRLDSKPPEQSGGALLFLTVGILLKKLQSNPLLLGVSHVVVDEVHERDINTDLLLALLRLTMQRNPQLRLVLMSATGDNHRLARYFGGCPVVKVPGFMHPVREHHLEDLLKEMGLPPSAAARSAQHNGQEGRDKIAPDVDLVADVIEHIDKRGEPGAVLVFLPGWQDIKAVQQKLEEKAHFCSGSQMILPLHSSLSVADQQLVFQHPPEGRRKIVLSTNIAETSITIDDIVHVVDAGMHREQNYDPRTKVSCLDTLWISRSNVTQRRGRAGRCQPGRSYHLYPRAQLETMSPFPIPEILRTPLESVVLQAKIHSPNCRAVNFLSQVMDSPEPEAVADAIRNLQDIGVLDRTERLTPLGERVVAMSCDPRLGKVLVLGAMFRCVLPMLSIVACLTRDPFHNSLQNRALVNKSKQALSGSSCSDYLVLSKVVQGWRRAQQVGDREERDYYLERHSLSRTSLRFINELMSQFSENLNEAGLVPGPSACQRPSSQCNQHSQQEELLKAVLLAGLYPNLIQVKRGVVTKGGRFRPNSLTFRTSSGPVLLHRSSVNRGRGDLPSRWLTFFGAVKSNGVVFIRDSSAVHPLALLLLTDCDITETVRGDRVEVCLPGGALVRCEMQRDTWELLWELRTSVQTMLYRNLGGSGSASGGSPQDAKLISLIVELLNNTSSQPLDGAHSSDSELD